MPPARTSYHHGNLRAAVIRAGLTQIDGGASLSMRALAREVGVTHRAVAREFVDLRGVRAALCVEILAGIQAAVGGVSWGGQDLRGALMALAVAYVGHGVRHAARYQLLWGPRLNVDGRHPELEDGFQGIFAPFHAVLREGMARGVLREHDVFFETLKFGSAIHGFVHLTIQGRWNVTDGQLTDWARQCVALPVDGLLVRLRAAPGAGADLDGRGEG